MLYGSGLDFPYFFYFNFLFTRGIKKHFKLCKFLVDLCTYNYKQYKYFNVISFFLFYSIGAFQSFQVV